jgi:hypothetical protein
VAPDRRTELGTITAVDAFTGLRRHSPWLLEDHGAAPRVLDLLRGAASLPCFQLRLGLDTYSDPELLGQRLAALVHA